MENKETKKTSKKTFKDAKSRIIFWSAVGVPTTTNTYGPFFCFDRDSKLRPSLGPPIMFRTREEAREYVRKRNEELRKYEATTSYKATGKFVAVRAVMETSVLSRG